MVEMDGSKAIGLPILAIFGVMILLDTCLGCLTVGSTRSLNFMTESATGSGVRRCGEAIEGRSHAVLASRLQAVGFPWPAGGLTPA